MRLRDGDGSRTERSGGGGGGIKGGVPLGYSTLGGFTISDQLDEKSGFRPRGGGREDSGYRVKGYQGIQIIALQEGGSKPEHRSF